VLLHEGVERGDQLGHGLLDYLIRPLQERRRDRQAERLGGLEVDDQLELCRLLYGEIGRLCTFEDAIDKTSRPNPHLIPQDPIR
jgi:hypothetical protein